MKGSFFSFILIFASSLFIYARWIEPTWIEVSHHSVIAPVAHALKILQLSDLHTSEFGTREKKVLSIIDTEKPDVIVVTGDSVSDSGDWAQVADFLKRLKAPLGVAVIDGNWEHWRPTPEELKIYQDANVFNLNNRSFQIADKVWIVGLDDAFSGSPDIERAFLGVPPEAFKVALFHSPVHFDAISHRIDLGLAGHTHDGQIRIPFMRPIFLPEGSGDYLSGWYTRGASRMYVSRGVGNSILEFRLASRPEVVIYTLQRPVQ